MKRKPLSLIFALVLCLTPFVPAGADTLNISETDAAYAVPGGNVYYDPDTGTITGCDESVTGVEFPPDTVAIGSYAFCRCGSLTEIVIPAGVTRIGNYVFDFCYRLERIDVEEGNGSYRSEDGVLFDAAKTALLRYPAGKEGTSYSVPEGVAGIERSAFSDCASLASVEIPVSVEYISTWAFDGCDSLADVYYGGTEAQWKEIAILDDNVPLFRAAIHYNAGNRASAPGGLTVSVNGTRVWFGVPPVISGGAAAAALAATKAVGCGVDWDGDTRTLEIAGGRQTRESK